MVRRRGEGVAFDHDLGGELFPSKSHIHLDLPYALEASTHSNTLSQAHLCPNVYTLLAKVDPVPNEAGLSQRRHLNGKADELLERTISALS